MKYNIDMQLHTPQRNFIHLFLFLVFASTLGWFINSYPPELLWQFIAFYLLLGCTLVFLFQFIFCNLRRSLLISIGAVLFFILRSFSLRHPLYSVLLFLCLISIEYAALKTRKIR